MKLEELIEILKNVNEDIKETDRTANDYMRGYRDGCINACEEILGFLKISF